VVGGRTPPVARAVTASRSIATPAAHGLGRIRYHAGDLERERRAQHDGITMWPAVATFEYCSQAGGVMGRIAAREIPGSAAAHEVE
jgi:hypothetical protein